MVKLLASLKAGSGWSKDARIVISSDLIKWSCGQLELVFCRLQLLPHLLNFVLEHLNILIPISDHGIICMCTMSLSDGQCFSFAGTMPLTNHAELARAICSP